MITVIILAGLGFLIYYFLSFPFNYWRSKGVPSPPISYLFGNVKDAVYGKKSIQEIYEKLYKRYTGFSFIGIYRVNNFQSFSDNSVYANENHDPLFYKNPFVSKGNHWKINRHQMGQMFTTKRIKAMHPLMLEVATNLIKYINSEISKKNNGIHIKEMFVKYTTDVVTSCSLGLDANSFTNPNSEYIRIMHGLVSTSFFTKWKIFIMFNFSLLSKLFRIRFISYEAERYYKTIIRETMEYREVNKVHRGDFLDSMLERSQTGSATTDDLVGSVITFFLEGTETSAITLTFTLYELAINLNIQEELRREVDHAMITHQGYLSFDVIQEMTCLDQVVSESMRKNTVVPTMRKVCTKPFAMQNPNGNDLDGVVIEPGTPVLITMQGIHHDHKYYPNPEIFDPSRFTEHNRKKIPNFAYLPFGEGPRVCLGRRFGLSQIKIALVHLVANFEFKINKKTIVPYRIDPEYFLLAAKDNVWIDFYRRYQ